MLGMVGACASCDKTNVAVFYIELTQSVCAGIGMSVQELSLSVKLAVLLWMVVVAMLTTVSC
jgi:hypothetical protein